MKKLIMSGMIGTMLLTGCGQSEEPVKESFDYTVEQFADLQLLRYKVHGFEELPLEQKKLVYYLSEAALQGRDILFDQNGRYNLELRSIMEKLYQEYQGDRQSQDFLAFEEYLKRLWFSNGIHHHYGSEKFVPGFSREWFVAQTSCSEELAEVLFNPEVMPKRVNQAQDEDLVLTSASNYYQGVTQAEAEAFYARVKAEGDQQRPVMHGMNSTLVKGEDGTIYEDRWTTTGKYGKSLSKVVENLKLARPFAEDAKQQEVIDLLVSYYETGDLHTFDQYTIAWVQNTNPLVDFVNGFTESYGDPLGMKASWESIVNFKDLEATKRTQQLSDNAQWFESNSPVAPEFKKDEVKGISAKVIKAAILGGDLYPSTAIGINLPNSNWVRAEHGSKSVTIANLTHAYAESSKGNGMLDEFVYSDVEADILRKYGSYTDDLHTDLHECVGHGSGKLMPGVTKDALKEHASTIEEARADLLGLYYMADPKLVELGLLEDEEAYKGFYYQQMMNGLMTQLVRIEPGKDIEESHMRNRQLIALWVFKNAKNNEVEMIERDGKHYLQINDYEGIRRLYGELLREIQRITSEGDYPAAKAMVEEYAVKVDQDLHKEILERYEKLNLAPYKGFVNPVYTAHYDAEGNITDVTLDYTEGYIEQHLRYSRDYSFLPDIN